MPTRRAFRSTRSSTPFARPSRRPTLESNTEYDDIDVEISPDTGEATIYANKTVVDEVADPVREIALSDAQAYDETVPLGEIFQIDVTPPNFGRIATQRARQAMQQALRDAEQMEVYTQFIEHQGEILVGRVTRVESRGVFIELGRAEAIMPLAEQLPGEFYRVGQRLRVLLLEVAEGGRGTQLRVSRGHADFVRRLFEREVPEIQNGLVEIMGIARDAGVRSKVAVRSLQDGLDPVGACVGMRGTRIQNILRELGQEKAEIIEWAAEPSAFVTNSLSPARVQTVHISPTERTADVFVHPDMVSLAIGREGQNSRLAARLTGFRIKHSRRVGAGRSAGGGGARRGGRRRNCFNERRIGRNRRRNRRRNRGSQCQHGRHRRRLRGDIALRHEPQRTCIACRTKRSKRELIRIVRTPTGEIRLDPSGRAAGRGAYICTDEACWPTAKGRGALAGPASRDHSGRDHR